MVTAVDGEEGRGRFPFMASDDRPKLPRATIRDEKLYVEGEKEPYFQDREHTIRLRVRELTIRRGYLPDYSNPAAPKVLAELLRGIAELEGGNRLAVVGLKTKPNMPIEFDLSPVPDTKTTHHWQASFWFRPHDRSLVGKQPSVSTDTAQVTISTTYLQRFGEAMSTTFLSTSRPLCGRRTSRRGTWHRQTTVNTATPSRR
jgi:hypothetical protein